MKKFLVAFVVVGILGLALAFGCGGSSACDDAKADCDSCTDATVKDACNKGIASFTDDQCKAFHDAWSQYKGTIKC